MRRRWRTTDVMRLPARTVFLASAAVLLAAALGGTAAGTAGAANAKANRLVAFGSCGELLGYAKAQAGRFVGPYGLAGRGGIAYALTPSPAAEGVAPSTAKDAA